MENKKEIRIAKDQIPPEGSLGLLALGDIGIQLWKEARKKKELENKKDKK